MRINLILLEYHAEIYPFAKNVLILEPKITLF